MKIIQQEDELLTNWEVASVLKDREADKQAVVSKARPSEIQTYQSLVEVLPVTRDNPDFAPFLESVKPLGLTKKEVLQILNNVPSNELEVYLCLEGRPEEFVEAVCERVLELVTTHLLPASEE